MPQSKNKNPKHLYLEQNPLLVTTRVKILLTFLVSLVLALLIVFISREQYLNSLIGRVETMSAFLDPTRIDSLIRNDANAKKNEAYLKKQLQQASGVNSDARLFQIFAISSTNTVYYLVDSQSPNSSNYKSLGDTYAQASEMLKTSFYTNQSYIESPVKDGVESWLAVRAPVYDANGKQIAVISMNLAHSTYYSVLAIAALVPILGAILVSSVFLATDTIRRRRQESVRMRSELVSIASHELRTPLTGIRWGEESLLAEELAHESRETLQSMYDSTIRLQESIEDILQLANWQAGRKQELIRTSTDIGSMIEGIFATQKLPAAQKHIKLEFATSWPKKLLIDCDAQRMKRVFNNLISNAIKYAKNGTAVIVAHQKVDGKHLITIVDQGIGIPSAEQDKVFAGFYRATNAIAQETNGTGMGLYMSRNAIEQHGGKLWLKSTEGKGTTVYIQLP